MVVGRGERRGDRASPLRHVGWLTGVAAMALVLAWLAPVIQRHFAPWLILPLLLGAALGSASWGLARQLKVPVGRGAIAAIALAAGIVGAGQHLFGWLEYRRHFERDRQSKPEAALMELAGGELRPKTLAEFVAFQAEAGRRIGSRRLSRKLTWMSWIADAFVVVLSAAGACYALNAGNLRSGDRRGRETRAEQ